MSLKTRVNTVSVFLDMSCVYVCVGVCLCLCVSVNIYADTDLYTAYMPRGGSMHGDRGKEVALHHPSRTQPSLLPRADPVSTISGLRRPRQGGRCSAPGE